MIPQTLIPNQISSNSSLKISKKGISKNRKKFIDLESASNNQEMTQKEFMNWIEEAENSPSMTLDEFNIKWEKKEKEILSRML